MESTLALGQPIPTGIITPTEILSPDTTSTAIEKQFDREVEKRDIPHFATVADVMTTAMVTQFLAWTSVTRSYLRFLGILDQDSGRA